MVPEGGKADVLFWTPLAVLALAALFAAARIRRLLRSRRMAAGSGIEIDDSDLEW